MDYIEKIRESLEVFCMTNEDVRKDIIVQLLDRDMLEIVPEEERELVMENILELERTVIPPVKDEIDKEFDYHYIDVNTLFLMELEIKGSLDFVSYRHGVKGYKRYIQQVFDSQFKGCGIEIQLSFDLEEIS